jgi:hypothetical protein
LVAHEFAKRSPHNIALHIAHTMRVPETPPLGTPHLGRGSLAKDKPLSGTRTDGPDVRHTGAEREAGKVLAAKRCCEDEIILRPRFGNSVRALVGIGSRVTPGAICLSNSGHFVEMPYSKLVKPVELPPGRVRPATRSPPTGSVIPANTIGTVPVARCNDRTAVAPPPGRRPARARPILPRICERGRHRSRPSDGRSARYGR